MNVPLHIFAHHTESAIATMLADIRHGLRMVPKQLPSKYFYDARGSELFEKICAQPEYYLPRAELEIMQAHAADMAALLGGDVLLVEYGSGSGLKTQLLLQHLLTPVAYVPVEISSAALADSLKRLAHRFPHIQMLPLCVDFSGELTLPTPVRKASRTVLYFPGSTLGNFDTEAAVRLLRGMRTRIGTAGAALIGLDLKKDRPTLEAAYNDAAGATAEFTLNMLARFNRELGADFDLTEFTHRARYNTLAGRIETHIVSNRTQRVRIHGEYFDFAAGEAMLVEYSCKYSLDAFARIAARAGLRAESTWTDAQERFCVQCLRAS